MDTAHSQYKLQVKNLSKTFTLHNRGSITVSGFAGIDFFLKKGQLLALSGPSGAGKSSILKTLYRTYLPTGGEINFMRTDEAVIDLAQCTETMVLQLRRREIGFITQFLKVLPRVTALDTVASPLIEMGETEVQARERAKELLLRLGIRRELLNLSPLTFSGGEQQRVNIARGIVAPKELIFIDEPTASLDARSAAIVLEILEDLKKQGIAMIAIFHDRKKIDRVADLEYVVKRSD
jgi:alpha-D-ribose 1-methylphosphonate 5-triphosphate synthase subunit PhnL